jgi:hypothetical protein
MEGRGGKELAVFSKVALRIPEEEQVALAARIRRRLIATQP